MYIKYKTNELRIVTVSSQMPLKSEDCTIIEKPEITTTDIGYIRTYLSSNGIVIEELSAEEKQVIDEFRFENLKSRFKQRVTRLRYLEETSSVDWNGTKIKTDETSQTKINNLVTYFNLNPDSTVNWKLADSWITLNQAQTTEIVNLVNQHIETCFDTEKQLHDQIDQAQTMSDLSAIQVPDDWRKLEDPEFR